MSPEPPKPASASSSLNASDSFTEEELGWEWHPESWDQLSWAGERRGSVEVPGGAVPEEPGALLLWLLSSESGPAFVLLEWVELLLVFLDSHEALDEPGWTDGEVRAMFSPGRETFHAVGDALAL